jgi:large subunit ribosomal protein L23
MVNNKSLKYQDDFMSQIDCIKYPIITNKSFKLFEKQQYTFLVDSKTNKSTIKTAIEYLFNVSVIRVNTFLIKKKKKRVGKYLGYSSTYKKAIVKLAAGNTINLFPEV